MVTIKQIAARAGVSTATVSNVLHGKLNKVSPETVEKVRKLIDEMGYVQPQGLRVLQKGDSHLVAVVVNYHTNFTDETMLSDPFYGIVVGVIERELQKRGYYMLLYSASDVNNIFKLIMAWNVDGVIAVTFSDMNCEKLHQMVQKPIISIDCHRSGKPVQNSVPNVGLDDRLGGYLMTRHLAKQGYESIYLCAYRNYGIDAVRWQGVQQAAEEMERQGRPCKVKMIELGLTAEDREQSYRQILRQMPFRSRTALFFSADFLAMEANSVFYRHGVKIPEDVGVAGFDDSSNAAQFAIPRLTTIRQDFPAKGRLAVDELVKALSDPNYKMQDHLLPISLVVRDSV